MKNNMFLLTIALGVIAALSGCGKDDSVSSGIVGDWTITAAIGVEWEEGSGIINTNDPDEEMEGIAVSVTSSKVTVGDFGTFDYTFSSDIITIDLGDEDLVFNVEFDGSNTMDWAQFAPDSHDDYEYNDQGENYLYYQKFWTLTRD